MGNSLSGWLVFDVPNVKEGIILARMEWWCGKPGDNSITLDWTEVNDGKTDDTTPWKINANNNTRRHRHAMVANEVDHHPSDQQKQHQQRMLGKPTIDQLVPKDFEMDVAINGKITKTWNREEWIPHTREYSKNCAGKWPSILPCIV